MAGSVVGGVAGGIFSAKGAEKQADATLQAAAMADPFRGERGYYQGILRNIYGGYGGGAAPAATGGGFLGRTVGGLAQPGATGGGLPGGIGEFLRSNPAYQFAREEALRGVTRQAAGQGLFRSGNLMAALQERASGLASQTYEGEINRLMTLSGATSGSPAVAGQLGGQAAAIRAAGQQQMFGQIGYGIQRGIDYFRNKPEPTPPTPESVWV